MRVPWSTRKFTRAIFLRHEFIQQKKGAFTYYQSKYMSTRVTSLPDYGLKHTHTNTLITHTRNCIR